MGRLLPKTIMHFSIRPEQPDDDAAIDAVTREAFANHPHSSHTEQFIVRALRAAGALSLSLVAEREGCVVGHIAFSPVAIADGAQRWFGLGPVSVLPAAQGEGVGRALIEKGLSQLRGQGSAGCVLLGEPAYYCRFGFANDPALTLPGVPQAYFMALRFGPAAARGEVRYHAAFEARQ